MLNGPFLFGLQGKAFVSRGLGAGDAVADGLAAVGHGAQIIRGSAVPVICKNNIVFAHHVQVGILQTGKGFLAGVLSGSRGAHGHGNIRLSCLRADVAVGLAHGLIHIGRHGDGKNGRLYQHGTLAQLVYAFL